MKDNNLPKKTESFWFETGKRKTYPVLQEDINTETAVVGGGIAGILTAYTLAKEGKKVTLLEGRDLLSGTTGYTTAKLSAQHQLIFDSLINRYGQELAQLYYQANMEGIAYIKQISDEHQIDCKLQEQDAFVYTQNPSQVGAFEKEADAYEKLGIPGSLLKALPVNIDITSALQMENQAQFQPVDFLHGVLNASKDLDLSVFEHSLVDDVTQDDEGTIHLKTNNGSTITCEQVVFATHYPTFEPDHFYTKMKPSISYALAFKVDQEYADGMYINADIPKRTFRKMQVNDENYLLVGGQSHAIGDDKSSMDRYKELQQFAKETFNVDEAEYRWSSHDLITKDQIPFIGQLHPDHPNIYTATGFNKWGLADAATGAKVLTDLILKRDNRYADMYYPRRDIPDIKMTEAHSKSHESEVNDLKMPDDIDNLAHGEATVIKKEDKEMGVYKDNDGKLHYMDIECTHLGCGLNWNNGDKTWDCPCHGSRFNAIGEVIEGPALKDLSSK